ncbi:MAG TPA: enoyl-CoA hydratase/isomerase family protein [Thermomicrobiales bacterium]|nr:enoyl-CoA hydratase/isomerase family protein [Thermomicrobiales bacterium]
MSEDLVLFEKSPEISTLTLNRPHVYNAVSYAMLERLRDILSELESDLPRVVIVAANGKGFCGGVDLKESREADAAFANRRVTLMHEVLSRLRRLPSPVVMAIEGVAAGLGAELAISGDIRIASPSARFGYPEPRVAVPSPAHHLVNLIGLARAQEMLLTARWVEAEEARQWGLATRIADDPLAAAQEVAAELMKLSPLSLRHTKGNIWVAIDDGARASSEHHIEHVTAAADTADRKEALAAFAEKREPRFTGQ